MGYIDPNHPMFHDTRSARGPGINTDEASSALPDLRDRLERGLWNDLAEVSGGARPNPSDGDDEHDEGGRRGNVIVFQRELFPVAFLTTGMWGPDPAHNARPIASQMGRRHLPLANPYTPRIYDPFFDRMRKLERVLLELHTLVLKRYIKNGTATSARRPWQSALERMIMATRFVLSQEGVAKPTIFDASLRPLGVSKWNSIAEKGNQKLPFAAYSELPAVTCPGAGACLVRYDFFEPSAGSSKKHKGWCYSFKAWRFPDSFARQFLNTLANTADREFSIIHGGGAHLNPADYTSRVQAAIAGMEYRSWPQFVKGEVLYLTRGVRAKGQKAFMRLFVDGDIGFEDSIVAWMESCAQMGPGGRDAQPGHGSVEVYGYSKCWQQFVNVNGYLQGRWPVNYTVNLSSGSVYTSDTYAEIRTAMEQLPISRGYFEAIPVKDYIKGLAEQTRLMRDDPNAPVPMPPEKDQPFRFDETRIRAFLRLNSIRTVQDLRQVMPHVPVPLKADGQPKELPEKRVRAIAYTAYLNSLVADPRFGAIVRRELYRDEQPAAEPSFLARMEEEQQRALEQVAHGGKRADEPFSRKALQDKALALALHETLWSFGLGGSCPLVCGNCSDTPTSPGGAHRCASKVVFRGKTIHIGLH